MSKTGSEFIRQHERLSLTNPEFCDRLVFHQKSSVRKQVYIFKVQWQSTAKFIRIKAFDEDDAWEKANKSKECKNCCNLNLVKVE